MSCVWEKNPHSCKWMKPDESNVNKTRYWFAMATVSNELKYGTWNNLICILANTQKMMRTENLLAVY